MLTESGVVGLYNRTEAEAYDDDENTLILHDRELARAYYAEWQRLWETVPMDRVFVNLCTLQRWGDCQEGKR
jgi:phosphatidylserine/phosphatidylglycerophosphate/cardiolipin synthase-like enzyme